MKPKYKKRTLLSTDDQIIQLKQKIIHYQSETQKYKQQVQKLNEKLKEVHIQAPATNSPAIVEEEKKATPAPAPSVTAATAFFSYSVFLPKHPADSEEESAIQIVGNFTAENTGTGPLHQPVICLRIRPSKGVLLGGKIRMQEQPNDSLFASVEEWVYAQNNWRETVKEKGEHWLAPLHVKALNPREKMIFSNFNLTIPSSGEHRQYIIEGFLYTKEFQQGIPALNTISLTAI